MMTAQQTLTPQVLWSQRSEYVTLVINLQDTLSPSIQLTPKTISFSGTSNDKNYHFDLEFNQEIVVDV